MSLITNQANLWNVGTATRARRPGIGGMLVVAGAVAYVAHIAARSMLTAGVDPAESAQAASWVPVNALGAAGAILVLLGMPALSTRIGGPGGSIGLGLIAASWMFFGLFLSLYGALVLPWLADRAPELLSASSPTPAALAIAFGLGLLAWLAGATLLAIPFIKGRAHPRWIGYLLPASALWFMVGSFVIAPDGPAGNLAVNLLSNLGPVLLLIALGYLGYRASSSTQAV